MNQSYTKLEREHLAKVKELPCSVCDLPGPSEAHHIDQSLAYSCVPLCIECHRGAKGIHGDKAMMKIYKLSELELLTKTMQKLLYGH